MKLLDKYIPVEVFMGSDTGNIVNTLFNTLLNQIQEAVGTSNETGSGFTDDNVELLYYYFQRIDIRRGESYIASPDWIASKKATINPKNEEDNECFKWPIIAVLNCNKIKEKELKKLIKFRWSDIDWESLEQENTSTALNILFVSHNGEEVNLANKSKP